MLKQYLKVNKNQKGFKCMQTDPDLMPTNERYI